jgi:hypothetical protein
MAAKNNMCWVVFALTKTQKISRQKNKGIAILWLAVTLIILVLFMGLSIDGARFYVAAHQLQNAADAAALAGARIVRVDQDEARNQAQYIGGLNTTLGDPVVLNLNSTNDPNGDIVIGRFYYDERGFIPLQDLPSDVCGPDALKAVSKRTENEHGAIPLFFGPIVNVDTVDVSRVAIAQAIGGWGAGIITLDCYASPSLEVGDAATDLILSSGGIQVNSNADDAFSGNTNTEYNPIPEVINVNGGVNKIPDELYDVTNTGAPRMPDPLCPDAQCDGSVVGGDCLPEPDFGPVIQEETVTVEPNETKTIGPGYYPGGIRMTNKTGTLNLQPGIYILDGEGLDITGGNLIGDELMFYITGTGEVNLRGGGIIELNKNKEIESGPFAGITIYQDRLNDNKAFIRGTDSLDITGVLYFPRNHVEIRGTGGTFGTQLITNTLDVGGSGTMQINYDGRNPFPANKAIIVW